MNKQNSRLRRAKKTRMKIKELGLARLSVHRTSQHIYAQVTANGGADVVVSASTLDKDLRDAVAKAKGKVGAASEIGKAVAKKALEKGVKQVAFDRAGFKYHGRVKALADAAREAGLEF